MPVPAADATCDVVILGAGAAGLMCAIVAAQRGRRVVAVDHANRIGKKILMSGGGRCNFTNLGTRPEHFRSANPHFCKSALARYTPWDFVAMVERHGIAYHDKEPGQLFCDDSSKKIVRMLLDECDASGARVNANCTIRDVVAHDAGFSVKTSQGRFDSRSLVIATGGLSLPTMGATGFGYALAQQFGHAVLPTRAGLVPLTLSGTHQQRFEGLSGVSLPVTARCNDVAFSGAMLVTHRGISGPAILQISSFWQTGDVLQLDLLLDHPGAEWLIEAQTQHPLAEFRNVLADCLPRRFAQRLCEAELGSRPMQHYREAELRTIADALHNWPLVASGTEGYRTAEVTLGGVATDAISSATMESRHVPGLHLIGEVLDVTGQLGGYNFQWAWASGHAAGLAV